ncbi:MAG: DUF1850 domain-containing protein [Rhizobiaceae bacterium]
MTVCLFAAGKALSLGAAALTLAWTHSVEKSRWEEDWLLTDAGLQIVAARVKGSGAGMEPAEGALLLDGWWRWKPDLPPQAELVLAASGATGEGWTICAAGECRIVGQDPAKPVVLRACP